MPTGLPLCRGIAVYTLVWVLAMAALDVRGMLPTMLLLAGWCGMIASARAYLEE